MAASWKDRCLRSVEERNRCFAISISTIIVVAGRTSLLVCMMCERCAIHTSHVTLDTIIIILYTICISTSIALLVFRGLLIVDEGRVILDNTTVSVPLY